MQVISQNKRLDALDGLRGIAILFVFLNHISSSFITDSLPFFIRPFITVFSSSGFLGVTFLFILCGFLMSYLYPAPKDNLAFLQKRYTRIFPLFIAMSAVRVFTNLYKTPNWSIRLLIIIGIAIFINFIWVKIINKIDSQKLNKFIFFGFIFLQLLCALFYSFWIMRQPAIVFNQQIPEIMRNFYIFLTNITLTLPFGNYVPMLDGVYWSLVTEVLFYLVYPFIWVPLIKDLSKKSKIIKVFFFISLVPFFLGIDLISRKVLGLSMIQFNLFFYFACGVLVGYLFRNNILIIKKVSDFFDSNKYKYLPFIYLFIFIFGINYLSSVNQFTRLMCAIPTTIILILALTKNSLSDFFSSKKLVFLGSISYSIYLTHTETNEIVKSIFQPTGFFSNVFFIFASFVLVLVVATITNYFLEKPYFANSRKKIINPLKQQNFLDKKIIFSGIFFIYIFLSFVAYQSNYNFFSTVYQYKNEILTKDVIEKDKKIISMLSFPKLQFILNVKDDNLGILTISLKKTRKNNLIKTEDLLLNFRIRELGKKDWYYQTTLVSKNIGDNQDFPFGFPQIVESKNKKYEVELEINSSVANEYIYLDVSQSVMKSVHQIDKKDLVKNPNKMFNLILQKINSYLSSEEARYSILLLIPISIAFFLL